MERQAAADRAIPIKWWLGQKNRTPTSRVAISRLVVGTGAISIPVVPHKAVAGVSKIGNL